jgi:protein-tyrosine phosphatase
MIINPEWLTRKTNSFSPDFPNMPEHNRKHHAMRLASEDIDTLTADFTSHHIEGIAREGNTPFDCPLITEIEPGFWQGGCRDGVSLAGKFKHVISLYPWEKYRAGTRGEELDSFVAVRLYDGPTVPDEGQLYSLAHWINNCRSHGPTLVHCQAGLNRSGLLAGLSLVVAGMKPSQAILKLREGRSPAVLCNQKFADWLRLQRPGQQHPKGSRGHKESESKIILP